MASLAQCTMDVPPHRALRLLVTAATLLAGSNTAQAQYSSTVWTRSATTASTAYSTVASDAREFGETVKSGQAYSSSQSAAQNYVNPGGAQSNVLWTESHGAATARAGGGYLSVYAGSSNSAYADGRYLGGGIGHTAGTATASFTDVGFFYLTGVPVGTEMTITAFVRANGSTAAGQSGVGEGGGWGRAKVAYGASLNGSGGDFVNDYYVDANGPQGSAFADSGFFVSARVRIGVAATISMYATAGVDGMASVYCRNRCETTSGNSYAVSDFAHTFTWQGVTSVTVNGVAQDLAQLRAESSSGFDYVRGAHTSSVPEPSSVWLLMTGLGVLYASARRRHTHRNDCD